MRKLVIVLLVISFTFLVVPITNANATPILLWPQSNFMNQEAAPNLTAWFAEQIDVPIDPSRTGEWCIVNETGLPEFLLSKEAYILPLISGNVKAQYVEGGILKSIHLQGNTSYVAESAEEEALEAVVNQISIDLGLDISRSQQQIEYAILFPGTPQEERQWLVQSEEQIDLGIPFYFNAMSITVREQDLRVVSLHLYPWYKTSGISNVTSDDAIAVALEFAESEHGAINPSGTMSRIAVRNGTGFVYCVQVNWEEEPNSFWTLDVWIDATTGEVLYTDGPNLIIEDVVIPLITFPWIPIVLIISVAMVVGLALFYRISAERSLDHFTRGRIFGYLQANPGTNYTKLRETMGLKNGTLAYHLWVLERLGFIKSVKQGRIRLLYLSDSPVSKGSLILSRLQYAILDLLNAQGSMNQADIARQLGMSRQRVHYNIKVLRSLFLVQLTDGGRVELSLKGAEIVVDAEGSPLTPSRLAF